MEDKIIEILKTEKRALTVHELETILEFDSVEQLKELLKVLNDLEDKALVFHTKKDKYMLFEESNSRVGLLQVTSRGTGYVLMESGEEIKIYPSKIFTFPY